MKSGDAHDRLRVALKSELQRNFGRIQEIERELSRSEGYLSKFCRGDISIPVDVLLDSLELLNTHPGRFFSRALGSSSDAYAGLRDMSDDSPDKSLSRILKALDQMALDVAAEPSPDADRREQPDFQTTRKEADLAEDIQSCSGIEQRRRLKNAKRYRTTGFADLYVKYLIQLCYNEPRTAAKQAETVITDLLPNIEAGAVDRLNLALRAVSAWAFGYRMIGQFSQAAYAIQLSLRVAARFGLSRLEGELIRVGAYLLSDDGAFDEALTLLGRALVIFDELDLEVEVGKVQVQRGIVYNELGHDRAAFKAFKRALSKLPLESANDRYRSAAFHGLSRAARNAGELNEAELWQERYLETLGPSASLYARGKALWEKGNLHYEKRDLKAAEKHFLEARDLLDACEASDIVLLCMDLTRVWLDQHRFSEAVELADGMACMLGTSQKNGLNEAALLEFIRAAHEGRLSLKLVEQIRPRLNVPRTQRSVG